jgi:hypothetical protein
MAKKRHFITIRDSAKVQYWDTQELFLIRNESKDQLKKKECKSIQKRLNTVEDYVDVERKGKLYLFLNFTFKP